MRKTFTYGLVPAAALAMALAAPAAFAQSASQPPAPVDPGSTLGTSATTPGPASDAKLMTQIKIENSLQHAGFKDVQVLNESFLVQARTADGTPVVMVINPPSSSMGASSATSGDSTAPDATITPDAGSSPGDNSLGDHSSGDNSLGDHGSGDHSSATPDQPKSN
ncbi:MAG TPA: hypothetical protein VND95_08380 [Stellaceae bacterium]|nr:hypothetical protein [Stellaceae bacterium]